MDRSHLESRHGCTKISQGCKNCYAKRDWQRLSASPQTVYYNRAFTDVRIHRERFDQPLRWTKPRQSSSTR